MTTHNSMDTDAQEIESMQARDDFEGLGKKIQQLFRLPQSLCKTRGNCCRVATFKGNLSYVEIQALAASDEANAQNAREFLTLFEPYDSLDDVEKMAPAFIERVYERYPGMAKEITFFKCRFVSPEGRCMIHEDRPTGCRVYPFPHEDTIYHPGCGFEQRGVENWHKIQEITQFFEKRFQELNAETSLLTSELPLMEDEENLIE